MRSFGIVKYRQFEEHLKICVNEKYENTLRKYRRDDLVEMNDYIEME
jgi:hypothetical protein